MNPTMVALQAGIRRGGIELRQTFTNLQDLWNYLFLPALFLIVMYFLRGNTVPGTSFSLSATTIPSVLGMQIVFAGLIMVATILFMEREDGTLLRAKATPNGMLGYLVGKIVHRSLHHDARRDRLHRQRQDRRSSGAGLRQPLHQLRGAAGVDDAAEPDPAVRRRAHRAVLTGGVDGRSGTLLRRQVRRGPPGQLELRVLRGITGLDDPVAALRARRPVSVDEHGAERLVARVQRLARQLDAPAQVREVRSGQLRHRSLRSGPRQTRTADLRLVRALLYQLSHGSVVRTVCANPRLRCGARPRPAAPGPQARRDGRGTRRRSGRRA